MKTKKDYFWSNETELKKQIELAILENNIKVDSSYDEDAKTVGEWIPFNLEREYLDLLIEQKRYNETRELLKKMRVSYTDTEFQNFIESHEYRLISILHLEEQLSVKINEAKKEFNQHTLTLVTIIVGLITIFGTANNNLSSTNIYEGLINFFVVVVPLSLIIALTLVLINKRN